MLFKVIADLKRQGVAIVYISHRLEELIRIGDYITVLRDGHITGQEAMKNVDTHWIVRQMIGSDAKDFAKADDHEPGAEVFRAEEICLPRATGGLAVDHVSLSLRAGEILGIYGLMGAGRSELFDCIMGRHGQATGKIFIDGEEVRERDTTRRIRRGLALDPGGPPARGPGPDPVGREQPDARQPAQLRTPVPHHARPTSARPSPRWCGSCRSRSRTPTTR